MGDKQVSQAKPLLKLLQELHNLRLNRDVESRQRLVADDKFRLDRQRTGDANALPSPPENSCG